MSYTPTEWKTGDTITAEKLNNMESGIAGGDGVTVVTLVSSGPGVYTSSHTFNEILHLKMENKPVILVSSGQVFLLAVDTGGTSIVFSRVFMIEAGGKTYLSCSNCTVDAEDNWTSDSKFFELPATE